MAQKKSTTRKPRATQTKRKKSGTIVQTTQVANSNGAIRFVEPQKTKKRRASKPKVVTIVAQTDDALLEQVGGFANFLREYGVVALAVGFIVGQQANAVVKQMVASFVDPLAKVWFGQSLSGRAAHLSHNGEPVDVPWGQFVVTLLDFFLIVVVIYIVIKVFKLDRLKKIEEPVTTAVTMK